MFWRDKETLYFCSDASLTDHEKQSKDGKFTILFGKFEELQFSFLISEAALIGVLRKSCSKNMQQIYRRTPMPKCDF